MKKLPFLKAFAQAWFGDKQLRLCSEGARGIWWEMCLIMHDEGEPYGHLARAGQPYPETDLLKTFNLTARRYRAYLQELESRGIFSRTEEGIIYSRRLVRDQATREHASVFGQKGAMHPRHPARTLKGRGAKTLQGHPEADPTGSPISNRVLEKRESVSSLPSVAEAPILRPPSADDIAARDAFKQRLAREAATA